MMLFGPLALGGLVLLVIWALGGVHSAAYQTPAYATHASGPDPRAALKARYARGEIDRDEYVTKLHDLA